MTDLGAACKELDKKLSRNEYLNSQTGAYAPVILLFSDGGPTDNWEKELKQLKLNNWFKHAIKIAIAIGDDADKAVLAEFTGTIESVITVNDKHTLKALIRKVSVRASEFQSHSKQSGDTTSSAEDDSAQIAQDAVNEIKQDASQNSPVSGGDSGAIDVSLDQELGQLVKADSRVGGQIMAEYYQFAHSVQGYNHIKANKVCQDASGECHFEDVSIIAVADGHGSDNYIRTDRGSKFAVSAALTAIKAFVQEARENHLSAVPDSETELIQIYQKYSCSVVYAGRK